MKQFSVNLQVSYFPIHTEPFYRKNYVFKKGDFPLIENCYQNEFSLPIYPDLSKKGVFLITDSVLRDVSL